MSLLSGFVGLGESLAKPAVNFITQQGVTMPAPKPVSGGAFSFDFGGAAQKLLDVFKPTNQAGAKILGSLADAGSSLIKTAGSKVEDVLRSGTQSAQAPQVQNYYVPNSNALPSQTSLDLSTALSLLGSVSDRAGAQSGEAEAIAAAAARNTQTNVLLIGGAALLLFLVVKGAK